MSNREPIRICIPTKDRPGNISLAISAVAQLVGPSDEIIVYDDGHRPASADYAFRFSLDIATQLGARVSTVRGRPSGIHRARAEILSDWTEDSQHARLLMVDDDILMNQDALDKMYDVLEKRNEAAYSVPIIALSNNEAGVPRFGEVSESSSVHDQQFVLHGNGTRRIQGGAWTCAIMLDKTRFNVIQGMERLLDGPAPAEDYRLTTSLIGYVDRSALVWHCMTSAQDRSWNSDALQYLREQMGGNKE